MIGTQIDRTLSPLDAASNSTTTKKRSRIIKEEAHSADSATAATRDTFDALSSRPDLRAGESSLFCRARQEIPGRCLLLPIHFLPLCLHSPSDSRGKIIFSSFHSSIVVPKMSHFSISHQNSSLLVSTLQRVPKSWKSALNFVEEMPTLNFPKS